MSCTRIKGYRWNRKSVGKNRLGRRLLVLLPEHELAEQIACTFLLVGLRCWLRDLVGFSLGLQLGGFAGSHASCRGHMLAASQEALF